MQILRAFRYNPSRGRGFTAFGGLILFTRSRLEDTKTRV
jgi:hypothetical protein